MTTSPAHRPLTDEERSSLISGNCTSDNWSNVHVVDGFDPSKCRNVRFTGRIKLGLSDKNFTDKSGVPFSTGIINAHLHNCTVGNNATICNIRGYVANYIIEDEVVIHNCGKIHVEGNSSFGNGTAVSVLNETGARSVRIWDRLSSQQAYISALYRHRSKAVSGIEQMTEEYTLGTRSTEGRICSGAQVINCDQIRNVFIGRGSVIEGALRLNEGSVNSTEMDPVHIGSGVIMDHFIICSGSMVTDSAIIEKCFIGQGCVLGKHFSAENSLFFANCNGFHGEACSVFAGPFTVTHHKSTLLIAGFFSFMNAGSGTNQSNHMYKLGPVHQGIVERGSKTASGAYLLWPARIGPFTLVMGKHHKNMDTSSLPFSYLIESHGESILVPAVNLKSIGTVRDAQKWPGRDKRKDSSKIDRIIFKLLNPYTVRKMAEGRNLLRSLQKNSGTASDFYYIDNLKISRQSLEKGIELYQKGIDKFIGNSLIKRLGSTDFMNVGELRKRLIPDGSQGSGDWIDLAGLITPKNEVEKILGAIENGEIATLDAISDSFSVLFDSYDSWEWRWTADLIKQEIGMEIKKFTSGDVTGLIEKWKKSVAEIDNLLYEDARKEFATAAMTGFGADGGDEEKYLDFEQVRGTFESNPIVIAIKDHLDRKMALGNELIERIGKTGKS
jgi:hypothetical protein